MSALHRRGPESEGAALIRSTSSSDGRKYPTGRSGTGSGRTKGTNCMKSEPFWRTTTSPFFARAKSFPKFRFASETLNILMSLKQDSNESRVKSARPGVPIRSARASPVTPNSVGRHPPPTTPSQRSIPRISPNSSKSCPRPSAKTPLVRDPTQKGSGFALCRVALNLRRSRSLRDVRSTRLRRASLGRRRRSGSGR